MEVLFQIHFWDKYHFTVVWNTRETGDIYWARSIEIVVNLELAYNKKRLDKPLVQGIY